jgi:ABC-type dipeptide/oligopeptide/nickel transport system permease component
MNFFIFVVKRLIRLALTVLIISTIIFFIIRVIPGDPALVIAGVDASMEEVEAVRERIGTNVPIAKQYVNWLGDIVRFDFGESMISGESVNKLIFERFPLTLTLAVMGIILGVIISIPLGVLSAVKRWSFWDYFGMVFSQIGMAVPSFWLAIILLLVFAVRMPFFPLFGVGSFRHLVLPAVSLGFARAAVILRLTRASMIEELSKEYIITARAKGLTDTMVKYKHALRNALIPVVTITGIQFGYMLGGAIIIEQVFSLPGLGRLFLYGIYQRDFPLVQGGVVFIAVIFSLVNFLVDVLYSVINPKIRIS